MSSRFRAVGSQNLTAGAFSHVTVDTRSQSVLGNGSNMALPQIPGLSEGQSIAVEGSRGALGAPASVAVAAGQAGASSIQWAANVMSGQTDASQDVQEGSRNTASVATATKHGGSGGSATTAGSSAPTGTSATSPGARAAGGDSRFAPPNKAASSGKGSATATKPAPSVTSAGRGATGVSRGGPASVRTAKGIQPARGLMGRAGAGRTVAGRAAASGGRGLPEGVQAGRTGRVGTRLMGRAARGTTQTVQRLAVMVRHSAVVALKGGAAAAMSPTTWVVAGVGALLLVLILTAGQLIGGASAGVAGSQQEGGACAATELVPEHGQEWLSEAVAASGLPATFLAKVIARESDWRPDVFAMDSNGGTWGLFQINRSEWARLYPASAGSTGTPLGITDPLLHARLGGLLMKQNYEKALQLQAANPQAAYAQLDPLEATVIIHNAGQGALQNYPNIPTITRDYVAEVMAGTGAPGTWTHPHPNATVTSQFGYRMHPIYGYSRLHAGTDFAAGPGSPIFAANSGTVTFAGFDSRGNGTIEIDHGNGLSTVYLHMYASGIHVRTGQTVSAGQLIGAEGSSGQSTGSHLHFEVRVHGTPTDAMVFLQENLGQPGLGLQNCGGGEVMFLAGGAAPVVQTAMSFQGVPYVWGGTTPAGFDCSGLMQYAYSRHGVTLPRAAHQQAFTGQNIYAGPGHGANLAQLEPGDLIAFSNSGGANYQHIGMYVGGGKMVHAPQPGQTVTVVGLDYWRSQMWRVQRVAVNDA